MKKLFLVIPLLPLCAAVLQAREFASLNEEPVFTAEEISAARSDPKRFTIDPSSVRVELVSRQTPAEEPAETRGIIGPVIEVINVASRIWGIVKKNVPEIGVETKYAAAIPRGPTAPNQLYEWKGPAVYEYKLSARNFYGMETVSVNYKVIFSYGGKWEGKGAYLTGVSVAPGSVKVYWGYKLFMSAFVPETTLTNIGTYENPIAAMQLKLSSKISTIPKEWDGESVYLISGDGKLKEIASPVQQPVETALPPAPPLKSAPLFDPETVFN